MNHLRFLARTDVVPHEAGAFFAEAGKSLCAGAQMEAVGTDIHFDALIWNSITPNSEFGFSRYLSYLAKSN
jgi:hypothetical protein